MIAPVLKTVARVRALRHHTATLHKVVPMCSTRLWISTISPFCTGVVKSKALTRRVTNEAFGKVSDAVL